MRPKFEVGEVVLLRSRSAPEKDGEYVVESCRELKQILDSITKKKLGAGYLYKLQGVDHSPADGWLESSLRKKHQPGEMSFDSLMASLSSPKLLTHQPEGVAPL